LKFFIVALASDKAWSGTFAKADAEFDVWNRIF